MYKIAIIGPESTGKSELAKKLAEYFNGDWVPEYAREYIENLKTSYNYDDVCTIARKQIDEQLEYSNNLMQGFVFFDTELIITKVWFEYCFSKVPDFLVQHMNHNFFDLYLLCNYDLDWLPDAVREHGEDRSYFFELYKNEIEKTGQPFDIISGKGTKRLENAITVINKTFKISKNDE
jgi:NadR type nicotinamide-nucleotide adenylyltransferase